MRIIFAENFSDGLEKYKLLDYISSHYENFNRYNHRIAELALAALTAGTPGYTCVQKQRRIQQMLKSAFLFQNRLPEE